MIFTDREWLRFVTFAWIVGATFSIAFVTAMVFRGHTFTWALISGVLGPGLMALIVHVALRVIIDRATAPVPAETEGETA